MRYRPILRTKSTGWLHRLTDRRETGVWGFTHVSAIAFSPTLDGFLIIKEKPCFPGAQITSTIFIRFFILFF